jgi:undecaprenyl diphosphate synthase
MDKHFTPQSTFTGLHVAIIMDGNGRWAQARGLPRIAGHREGAEAVRRVSEAALSLGVRTLTLYAFSADNWKRPPAEVGALMHLFERFLRERIEECQTNGVRLTVIGRRDRLPDPVPALIAKAERETAKCRRLNLRLAVDYSSRDAILKAAAEGLGREEMGRKLGPDVDLLIRTSGERRLSDFLLWECAYAEFYFTPTAWPEFGQVELAAALADFSRRDRRYGALPVA